MSFDTDYLNSQKRKLNESISNFIRLTYLVSIVRLMLLLLPNFQRSFSFFCYPFFNCECKCTSFFISTKIIFLFTNVLTTFQNLILLWNLLKKRTNFLLFKSGLQRYYYFTIRTKFLWFLFLKKMWKWFVIFYLKPYIQKAVAKIISYWLPTNYFTNFHHNYLWKTIKKWCDKNVFQKADAKIWLI